MLTIHQVWKTYRLGSEPVLDGFSLDLPQGEFLSLVGQSGSGKSTLLRLIAGLDAPDRGTISVDGKVVTSSDTFIPPQRRGVGMIFQSGALFPHLTVAKNIGYGISRRPKSAVDGVVQDYLALIRMPGKGQRYPHELSGGERQRVAIARALAADPALILLDEPFSSLDSELRTDLRAEIREILKSRQMTAILVTHDREEAEKFGDQLREMTARSIAAPG